MPKIFDLLRGRLRAAGLTQTALAGLLGRLPSSVSEALDRGGSGEIVAAITAWELMDARQRMAWLGARGVPAPRRRGRPRQNPRTECAAGEQKKGLRLSVRLADI